MTLERDGRGRAVVVALAAALGFACATSPSSSPAPPEEGATTAVSPESPEYVIGAADVVRVQVWRNPELTAEVPVRPDGKISVPLLNDVQAAGLTAAELREVIAGSMAEYVSAPDVTVTVIQVNSKQVYVVGEVLRPAAVPLTLEMRALDAIATVGGFSPYADKDDIKILRSNGDGSITEHRFDYPDFVKGRHPEANLVLHPGDTIVVPD